MLKVISGELRIALDRMKLIHKGRLLSAENVRAHVEPKAVFQAIGERHEDESDVDTTDIELIMTRLAVSRDVAVSALKHCDNVLDAMLRIGNNI